jgi:hypothetical protein
MENLPFYGNISMEIGTYRKFPCIYGHMPRDGGVQNLQNILRILSAKFPPGHENLEIRT